MPGFAITFLQIFLLPCSCCKLSASLCHQQAHSQRFPVDYRSEGRLIQSPPGRGSEPCRFNPESRVTGVCVGALSVRFSLIVRLVREVIKIVWGVLARVLFGGFGVWNRGRFWGFLRLSRKCVGAVCFGCLAVSLWCVVGFGEGVGTFAVRGQGFIWCRVELIP